MHTQPHRFILKASVAMVRAALASMALAGVAAAAETADEDPAVSALTRPTSSVEIGVGAVGKDSYKYGEYNGLQDKGAYAIGNIDLEKRGAYEGEDTTQLRVRGSNLGLETRELRLDYGQQGKFKINLGYDELRRNFSDSYQTPFNGAGSNSLSLPGNWITPTVPQSNATNLNYRALSPATGDGLSLPIVAGVGTAPTGPQLATLQGIRAADLPAFRDYNLHTKRTRYDAGFSYNLNPEWGVSGSFRHELKDGAKPSGAISAFSGDSVVILPEMIDTTTEQYNLALNYVGDKVSGQIAYYGSVFDNQVKSMTWQDPKVAGNFPSMSTAPSNQFHEINLTGAYSFTSATKVVVNGSYGRGTQNEAFLAAPAFNTAAFSAPAASLEGLVVTKTLGMTLTTKPAPDWHIATGLKYIDRDNRTPVNRFIFYDADVATTGTSPFATYLGIPTLGTNANIFNNRPMSKTVSQFSFNTDYKVRPGHTLAAGYEWEKADRSCNDTWIACADADTTKENTLKAEWRAEFSEDLSTKVAYSHARRTVDYNENAWLAEVPLANVIGTGATISVYDYITQNGLTGFGPWLGFPAVALAGNAAVLTPNNNIVLQRFYGARNNVSEIPGMRRFNLADRNRDRVRTSVNWQTTERLSLQGGVDFNRDEYDHTVYGLQEARDYAINLDGTYLIGDSFSASLFFSHENQRSRLTSFPTNISNTNPATAVANNVLAGSPCYSTVQAHNGGAKIDPCNQWSADMHDISDTLGFSLAKKKLLAGKLDLSGSLLFTHARSDVGVSGGTYVNNPLTASAGEPGVFFIAAEDLPRVTTDIVELGLSGDYRLDKKSSVRLMYSYQRLKSSPDFAYDGLQTGSLTAVMPTNEQVSTYSIHAVGVSFVHKFQ